MAWIESHQSLKDSHKLYDLMASMEWELHEAVGRLQLFWWWCVDHAEDGDLTKFKPHHLAIAAGLSPVEGEKFMKGMVEAGFIDLEPGFRLHDWWDYFGTFLRKRYSKRPEVWQRVRDLYQKEFPKGDGRSNPGGTEGGSPRGPTGVLLPHSRGDGSRPQPDQTKPDLTKPVSDKARVRHSGQDGELSVTNAALPPPTLEKVLSECDRLQLPHWVGEDFFNLWESRAWRDRDTPVRNWKSLLNSKKNYWVSDGRPMKRPGKANDGSGNQGHAVPKNGKEWDIADVL